MARVGRNRPSRIGAPRSGELAGRALAGVFRPGANALRGFGRWREAAGSALHGGAHSAAEGLYIAQLSLG
jgi:hypothetical protein